MGIATDYCVKATAADAVAAGFNTRVLLDLTAGVAPTTTAEAVDALRAAGVAAIRRATAGLTRISAPRSHRYGAAGPAGARRSRYARTPSRASSWPISVQMNLGLARAHRGAVEVERIPQQPLAGRHRHRRGVGGDVARHLAAPRAAPRRRRAPGCPGPAPPPGARRTWLRSSRISAALAMPDQPRQHPVRVRVADDAAAHLHDAVLGVGGEEPDVALQRQRQPQPQRMAVDRGDHRLAQRPGRHVEPAALNPAPAAANVALARRRGRRPRRTRAGCRSARPRAPRRQRRAGVRVGQFLAHAVADRVALSGRFSVMVATPASRVCKVR